jgi:hypothetical protein
MKSLTEVRRHALATALLAFTLYANSLVNGFVLDDSFLIVGNPWLEDLSWVPRLLSSDYWAPAAEAGLYRPLTSLTYALNHAVGGPDPFSYHLTNVLLHAANSVLVLLLVRRVTGMPELSLLSALLFASHPIHTEVVAGVTSGRPDLLAAAFMLLSLVTYAVTRRTPRDRALLPAASLLFFALALVSKESAIVLPILIPLVGHMNRRDEGVLPKRLGSLLADTVPYFAVALVYLTVRWRVLESATFVPIASFLDNPLVELEPGWRLLSAVYVGLRYLWLLIFPLNLAYDYSFDQIPPLATLGDPRTLLVAVTSLVGPALVFVLFRRSRIAAFAISFSFVTFCVVANVIVPIGTIMGERLLYVPSIGFVVLVAGALVAAGRNMGGRFGRRALPVLCLLLLGCYSTRSVIRNADWRSEEALFLHDVATSPRSAKVQANAGAVRLRSEQPELAVHHYTAAINTGIRPDQYPMPYFGYVRSLLLLGRVDEARRLYERLLPYGFRDPVVDRQLSPR